MADFCHDFDPGGLGGDPPMGDFNWSVEHYKSILKPGLCVVLGICEAHGCTVSLVREEDGSLWFHHDGPGHDYIENKEIVVPEPKRIDDG